MPALGLADVQALFAQEAQGRLATLGQLLLRLEATADDAELIRSIFREIHTLKGSSAVAGLDEVSRVAHELEEVVEELRSGTRTATPELIDTLLAGADRLEAGIAAALGGAGAGAAGPPPAPHLPAPPAAPPTVRPGTAVVPATAAPVSLGPAGPVADAGAVVMVPIERLDELTRMIGESATAHLRVGRMLKDRFGIDPASSPEYNELSRSLNGLQDRAMRTRMVPVATITDKLQRAVRDVARGHGKQVRWEVRGIDTELDRGVLNQLSDSLLHLVRNAADHGIEPPADRVAAGKPPEAMIRLHAMQLGSEVIIAVTDNGRGIDVARVRERASRQGVDTDGMSEQELLELTFRSGLSTTAFVTDVSGRGVGLDVVRTSVESVRGRVEVRSVAGAGTEFRIIVPITLAVLRCLLVEAGGQQFALPFHRVVETRAGKDLDRVSAEGRTAVWAGGRPVPVSGLAETLGTAAADPADGPVVVLTDTARRHAFRIDRLVGQRDVVLKGLNRLLPHLPAVAGAGVEPDGSVLLVLDPPGLIQRALRAGRTSARSAPVPRADTRPDRILVVDDALTVRELQRSILERAGFQVRVAIDGREALARLAEEPSDLVLTDIEMPNLDGFGLTEAIRADPALANVPVLILSSRASDADRQRGLDVGADGYIVKSGFDESSLLASVNRLLGGRP
ncbi:MAG TPA: response regulator [Mycobacteriales bacterium]|nr:response regulator [Mycobacteriales bacterium]